MNKNTKRELLFVLLLCLLFVAHCSNNQANPPPPSESPPPPKLRRFQAYLVMNDRAKREVIEFEAHRCVSRYLSEVLDGKKTPLIYLTCGVGQHQWGRPRLEGEYEYYYAKDKEVIVFEGIVDAYREISLGEQ